MTEREWLASKDPERMLRHLGGWHPEQAWWLAWLGFGRGRGEAAVPEVASIRKRRLYACACCRRIERLFCDERSLAALDAAERWADERLDHWEWQEAVMAARQAAVKVEASPGLGKDPTGLLLRGPLPGTAAMRAAAWAAHAALGPVPNEEAVELAVQAARETVIERAQAGWATAALGAEARVALLREIFGNPFRPPAIDPAWRSWNDGTVRRLAEAIYEQRRFADLPILADALEEAGCADAALLDHLRGPGPHVLGCWALDLLLAKS